MKVNWFFLFFLSVFNLVNAQSQLLVTNTFKEVSSFIQKKPVVVFIHTDWCKPCVVMKATTFKDEQVIKKLNKDYYFISFNAESKVSIKYKNKVFKYKSLKKNKGIHELAEVLGTYRSKLSYPTIVVLDTKNQIVFQHPSKLKAKGFLRLLTSIEENEKL